MMKLVTFIYNGEKVKWGYHIILLFIGIFSLLAIELKLESKLAIQVQSRNEIKQLKDRCKMLEYVSFPAMGHLAEDGSELEEFNSCSDELILIGGFDGSSWLLGLDSYSPSQDQMESLTSMSAIRRYASAGRLNGEIYIFGGANDDVWYDTGIFIFSFNFSSFSNCWVSISQSNKISIFFV
jgi:kelch-like protein 20